jgi:hypothetical protein
MTSDIQLEANRNNAQKSTGPTSQSGKAAVRFNATRHGLTSHVACMTWEDRDAFDQFCAGLVVDFKPEGAIETQLAQAIAEDHWRMNRARAIEENLFALGFQNSTLDAGDPQATAALSQAETFRDNLKSFNLITLYETRLNRNVQRNMDRLRQIQADRRSHRINALAELTALNAINRANRLEAIHAHHGFVFSDSEITLAARGQHLSSMLAEATLLAGVSKSGVSRVSPPQTSVSPPKTSKSTGTITYRDAA